MKYGEILDIRTKDKAVIGKTYVFSDNLYNLINLPQDCFANILVKVKEDSDYPFSTDSNFRFQFAREIIEEEPKYRPYKDTDEMIEDFKKRTRLVTYDFCLPSIWIKSCDGFVSLITEFGFGCVWSSVHQVGISMKELFDCYTYLDGSPCGIKEER